ncbi:MAG: EF-hand domain-containing protein [Saprospiraceae bacterium]|nr:EF-hand domain-containing protein [Saprospiraceae bacterium]
MASKKQILNKLRILITQKFDDPDEAFRFFDKNSDGMLSSAELKKLIADAEVNRFLSGIVANKLLDELDADQDRSFDWQEFRKAVRKLIDDTGIA